MEFPSRHDGKMGRIQSKAGLRFGLACCPALIFHSDNWHRKHKNDRLHQTGVFDLAGMGKIPVRLKEVTYTISPFEVSVLSGLFKDLPSKIHHKFQQHWVDVGLFFALPTYATFWYANNFKEKEKHEHRY